MFSVKSQNLRLLLASASAHSSASSLSYLQLNLVWYLFKQLFFKVLSLHSGTVQTYCLFQRTFSFSASISPNNFNYQPLLWCSTYTSCSESITCALSHLRSAFYWCRPSQLPRTVRHYCNKCALSHSLSWDSKQNKIVVFSKFSRFSKLRAIVSFLPKPGLIWRPQQVLPDIRNLQNIVLKQVNFSEKMPIMQSIYIFLFLTAKSTMISFESISMSNALSVHYKLSSIDIPNEWLWHCQRWRVPIHC